MKKYGILVLVFLFAANATIAADKKIPKMPPVQPLTALVEREGKFYQPVKITLDYQGDAVEGLLQIGEAAAEKITLKKGVQTHEGVAPAVEKESQVQVKLAAGGKDLVNETVTLKPVRKMTIPPPARSLSRPTAVRSRPTRKPITCQ